jgi:hypothetical protein
MICSLSSLNEGNLSEIKSLESELGQTLLAFSCHSLGPAKIDNDKLAKIQALEKKLGISLVAVEA